MDEKLLLIVVYAIDKFRSYLIISKVIIYTDHLDLWYLLSKANIKLQLIWWVLLLYEFVLEIKEKKGAKNLRVDHLFSIENLDMKNMSDQIMNDTFPEEHLYRVG